MSNKKDLRIDFVVTWVDGDDKEWLLKRGKYSKRSANDSNRFRDWGLLKYWFRAIEKYTPWVNKVFLITDNQKPSWLNEQNEKLIIVDHRDYIDNKYLPLFNSNAIEAYINDINGLSEKFVLFNDDFFILRKMKPTDFFRNGMPVDQLIEDTIHAIHDDEVFPHILLNDIIAIDKYNNKKKILLSNPTKVVNVKYGRFLFKTLFSLSKDRFVSIRNSHSPQPFLKSSFSKMQKERQNDYRATLENRFRSKTDISQYLVRYYQLLTGNFVPRGNGFSEYFNITDENVNRIVSHILKSKTKTVCLNDSSMELDFEMCRNAIKDAFDRKLPEKSTYEK